MIKKLLTAKQRPAALVVDGALYRHMRQNGRGFAARRLLPVSIAGVGYDPQALGTERLLRSFRHRLHLHIISRLQRDGMGNDQRVLGIDRRLHAGRGPWSTQRA